MGVALLEHSRGDGAGRGFHVQEPVVPSSPVQAPPRPPGHSGRHQHASEEGPSRSRFIREPVHRNKLAFFFHMLCLKRLCCAVFANNFITFLLTNIKFFLKQ